jgi:hypothetical protein
MSNVYKRKIKIILEDELIVKSSVKSLKDSIFNHHQDIIQFLVNEGVRALKGVEIIQNKNTYNYEYNKLSNTYKIIK